MRFTSSGIAAAVDGTVVGPDVTVNGVSIDSRSLTAGQLFVPLVAERDGHDFIAGAIQRGVEVWFSSTVAGTDQAVQAGLTAIEVADTMAALTALGSYARQRLSGEVIGITGSVGKTSTKDLMRAVLAAGLGATHANVTSFNNEIGVPLTLAQSSVEDKAVIVEMGSRGVGHIADLCAIAAPTIGVVTTVGAAHTSEFGNVETVAKAKGELVAAVGSTGTVVLNADNPWTVAMTKRTSARCVMFGLTEGAEVTATDISMDAQLRPRFTLVTPSGSAPVGLEARGAHNVMNALAAAAVGHALGLSAPAIANGLGSAVLSPWRMEVLAGRAGSTIINDAYNANAISTEAALRSLAAVPATRQVAVLGVMAELGDLHDADHQRMAALAAELGIEVIAFQEEAYGLPVVGSLDEAEARIGTLTPDTAVLVKGSRVAGLESLAQRLLA